MLIGTVVIISTLFALPACGFDSWVEPNAWELHARTEAISDSCPVCDAPEITCPVCDGSSHDELVTTLYYKALVNALLNRKYYKKNPQNGNLERVIHLSLSNAQMKAVENWTDLRDLNAVVSLVLSRARELELDIKTKEHESKSSFSFIFGWLSTLFSYLFGWLWKFSKFVFHLFSNNSETRFVLSAVGIMLAMYFVHKRYNKNLIFLVVGFMFVFGYLFTYIECNRKLEVESFIEFTRETEPEEPNFIMKFLGGIFRTSRKEQAIEKIKKDAKIKMPFCRPDDVVIMYFNDMFFGQLQVVVEKIAQSMHIIQDQVPFPYNYMGMVAFPFLFWLLVPFVFHYLLNPTTWYNIARGFSSAPQGTNNNHHAHQGDRLSGENLENFLAAIRNARKDDEKLKHSAVEDVKDKLPAIGEKSNESTDESSKIEAKDDSLCDEKTPNGDCNENLSQSQNEKEKQNASSSSSSST